MSHLHPKLGFIPQQFNPVVLKIAHIFLPMALRFRTRPWLRGKITKIEAVSVENIVHLYQQFQAGKIRFLIAFHHPEVEDPLCLLYLFSRIIPRAAKQMGVKLKQPIHTHFMYDRGMTIWGGKWLGWLLSRGGGVSIHRGRLFDRTALYATRDLLVNGQFPFTIAPEGATNGHSEIISPIEPGLAQLGFWCIEDLKKTQRAETVWVIPIGIRYYYLQPPWRNLNQLLSQLEQDLGLIPGELNSNTKPELELYPRLLKLAEVILTELEEFYQRFYHQDLPPVCFEPSTSPNTTIKNRLDRLLETALKVTEEYFNVSSRGTIIDRCRRLEEAGWRYIYREEIEDISTLSAFQFGLGNWVAEEAEIRLKHMRLVESFVAVTGDYIKEKQTVERFAETLLILFDLVERIKGKKNPRRPQLGKRRVKIIVGNAISVSDKCSEYQSNSPQTKPAVKNLKNEIEAALNQLVKD
ncbi:MAG: 1-acyl-sn-glycerol-3-phosphate acyltransferase [Microcoleaceae cyanobacterium]